MRKHVKIPWNHDVPTPVSQTINWDSDVPIPPLFPQYRRYPWREMEIGGSFLVDTTIQKNIRPVASRTGKKLKRLFIVRKQLDGNMRVWRVK